MPATPTQRTAARLTQTKATIAVERFDEMLGALQETSAYADQLDITDARSPRRDQAATASERAAWIRIGAERIRKRIEDELLELREIEAEAKRLAADIGLASPR